MKRFMLSRIDPTGTLTLRTTLAKRLRVRFLDVLAAVKTSVVTNDCFLLSERNRSLLKTFSIPNLTPWKDIDPLGKLSLSNFSIDSKISLFNEWFSHSLDQAVLQRVKAISLYDVNPTVPKYSKERERLWIYPFLNIAYLKGIQWARFNIKRDKDLLSEINVINDEIDTTKKLVPYIAYLPMHQEAFNAIETVAENDLRAITETVVDQSGRKVLDGLLAAATATFVYSSIKDRIEKIGITRSKALAMSYIIKAHHVASIVEYKRMGIDKFIVYAEWTTAADSRVCPKCKNMEGRIFTADEILPLIPLHPLCRCAAIPVGYSKRERYLKKEK